MPAFTVKLDDPAGNSFIEFYGSLADPKWNMRTYHRTRQNNVELGLIAPDEEPTPLSVVGDQEKEGLPKPAATTEQDSLGEVEGENEEIYSFPGTCSSCGHPLNTLMKKVVIPYFKVHSTSVH